MPTSFRPRYPSIHLTGYDYSQPGAYFVTICTANRLPCLGTIADAAFVPSECGRMVTERWHMLPRHFPGLKTPVLAVMPDHLHGILVWQPRMLEPEHVVPAAHDRPGSRVASIPAIVQNFKSVTARQANAMLKSAGRHFWQPDYYERVIRDREEYLAIRQYILDNPARWEANERERYPFLEDAGDGPR